MRTMRKGSAIAAGAALLMGVPACGGGAGDRMASPRSATLDVLPDWAAIHPDAAGHAVATVDGDDMTVIVTVEGFEPDAEYSFHVHDAPCEADPPGGAHWLDDPDEGELPHNEVGASISTNDDGSGSSTVVTDLILDSRAKSVVVHAGNYTEHAGHVASDRLLCGDLSES
jgi:hypothetical protein